ncbi:histidinol phosphate phosphatase domain-containing protein [Virgibacillus necropolis]|uniref:Histidinol-phosphatase n=1 Tax=Virgibacillus necropolis TaxID=163877 RepID=A0A221M9J4_9BACI|nr:histidinol phosphate phosphatase domain-containing protein [Virgibacillus necropolis]ASN04328.1 histidinol-phosphatase [Virgibacillus necropolis]
MKVDYHLHLEEGPYSVSFLNNTYRAIQYFYPVDTAHQGTKEGMNENIALLSERFKHTEFSEWWLELYLEEALRKGLKEVGIVDHLYRFRDTRDYFLKYIDVDSKEIGEQQLDWLNKVMVRDLHEFVDMIQSQKNRWRKKGIELRLGMEADYFEGGEEELQKLLEGYPFDYVIGSVHFLKGWGFDNPQLQHRFKNYNLVEIYEKHFNTIIKAAKSKLFDFLAHLDNLKVFNYRPDESQLAGIYEKVAKTLAEHDVATEVNPGLYYRYPVKEMCPSPRFMEILVKHGVKFTTSSDSHFPDQIGIYNEEIQELLRSNGINNLVTFENRKRIMKPFL